MHELAASGEQLVATHLPFPSVCHVAVAGNAFRFVPDVWDYSCLPMRYSPTIAVALATGQLADRLNFAVPVRPAIGLKQV